MEIGSKDCVVMTPDGQFLTVPRQDKNLDLGDEIHFQLKSKRSLAARFGRPAWITSGLTAVAVMIFTLLMPQWATDEAHASSYVYIDLNPSLELALDKDREVVKLRALNSSAKHLVKGMEWKGAEVKDVVVNVLSRAKKARYLDKKERVLISQVEKEKQPTSKKLLAMIEQEVKDTPELSDTRLDLYTLPLPDKLKREAETKGISPAKYAVGLVARRNGEKLSIEELSTMSISDLMKKVDLSPVLRNPPSDQDWTTWIEEDQKQNYGDSSGSTNRGVQDKNTGSTGTTKENPPNKKDRDNQDRSSQTPSLPLKEPVSIPEPPPPEPKPPAVTEPPPSSPDGDGGTEEKPPADTGDSASSGGDDSSQSPSPNTESNGSTP